MSKLEAIIFDLDGTLWDSIQPVTMSWNSVLAHQPDVERLLIPEDIRGIMGLVISEIAEKFFPNLTEERRMEIIDECYEVECNYLAEHGARLYDGLEAVLMELSQNYPLYIVSNCQQGYIEAFLKAHHLDHYFSDRENSGNTGMKKGDNIKLIMQRNQVENAIYVGDTQGDCDAAEQAGTTFVFASYGFGTVEKPDWTIGEIQELPNLVKALASEQMEKT